MGDRVVGSSRDGHAWRMWSVRGVTWKGMLKRDGEESLGVERKVEVMLEEAMLLEKQLSVLKVMIPLV
ncbi:hypothetical protein VNO78_21726 [Psophocarpus tetragonolobus]|uniref:Uncharacterized protein n=1 Tax=Psophocarpus tetragonolobus TaxID=3891 RepID=A0AAN9XHV7_PSOTE